MQIPHSCCNYNKYSKPLDLISQFVPNGSLTAESPCYWAHKKDLCVFALQLALCWSLQFLWLRHKTLMLWLEPQDPQDSHRKGERPLLGCVIMFFVSVTCLSEMCPCTWSLISCSHRVWKIGVLTVMQPHEVEVILFQWKRDWKTLGRGHFCDILAKKKKKKKQKTFVLGSCPEILSRSNKQTNKNILPDLYIFTRLRSICSIFLFLFFFLTSETEFLCVSLAVQELTL